MLTNCIVQCDRQCTITHTRQNPDNTYTTGTNEQLGHLRQATEVAALNLEHQYS